MFVLLIMVHGPKFHSLRSAGKASLVYILLTLGGHWLSKNAVVS